MKNFIITAVIVLVALAGTVWWSNSLSSEKSEVITRSGLHWHPELEIYVKGEKVVIPPNIGLGTTIHNPIHTHEDLPIIHLEFAGRVTAEDTELGNFFKIWGKELKSFGSNVIMTVNGQGNTEFEKYRMHDKDKIEIRFD